MNPPQPQSPATPSSSPSAGGLADEIVGPRVSLTGEGPSAGASRDSSPWPVLASAFVVALAAIGVYYNSFHGPLIFDDHTWIADNPTIRRLWPLGPVLFPPKSTVVGGRPVLNLTLSINYALGGTNVWGYHAVNLAIHILAAWTLLGVVRRTLLLPKLSDRFGSAATPLALAVAILWAVHPLQTSAVTYLTQRNESLMALFYLLTLYGVIRGATASNGGRRAGVWYATAIAACLLGMLTKETMVTAPLVVLLYDRASLAGTFGEAIRRRWGLYAAMLATWSALAWCLISTDFHGGSAGFAVKHFTPWSYLLTEPGVIAHYLEQSFWPAGLCLDYGWPPATTVGEIVPAGLLIVSLLGLTCWALVKRPILGFLGASFFLILAPTSSFIPIDDAAFDHRMYLPLAAVIALAVIGVVAISKRWLVRWLPRLSRRRFSPWIVAIAGGGVATVALSWATISRNELFESELTIWQDACTKRPDNARALDHVGTALKTLGRTAEAVEFYRRAMAADSKYVLSINNLAGLYADMGERAAAEALYRQALDVEPDQPWVNINLASVLARQGKLEEAAARCQGVLTRKPDFPEADVVLADVRLRQGRWVDAERLCREALQLNPDLTEGHAKLATILMLEGKTAEAIEQLRQLADANPRDARARDNLAVALATQNRNQEAATEFRAALSAAPNAWAIHFHFGFVLARQGLWADAVSHWREAAALRPDEPAAVKRLAWALATSPDASVRNGAEAQRLVEGAALSLGSDPEALDALAAAQADIGQFDKAAKTAERAMFLATQQRRHDLATRIADRLSLYLTRTPYRDTEPPAP